MTTITVPPDLEARLAEEALRRDSTPEAVAIDELRRRFPAAQQGAVRAPAPGQTMYDFLKDYIGVVEGSGEAFSEDCGRRFAEGLEEKRKAGRL